MKLPGLIDLSLILTLVSVGHNWDIQVMRSIHTPYGSDVIIPCMFSYPEHKQCTTVKEVYWKKAGKNDLKIEDNDRNPFVYHNNPNFVLEKYRGKTKLIGNKTNCTLKIQNITENEPNIYVRVKLDCDNYSFKNHSVSISVSGGIPVSPTPYNDFAGTQFNNSETITTVMPERILTSTYIFVPIAALLIILLVAGIVFCKKYKRSQSFIREESGYYANFSRPSSNQAEREASCIKQDNNKLPALKAIDEPVYINMEAPPGQMDESMEGIYANVDHSK
ncbi:myelin-associated glycoprotein-like [Pempheris klunzingeri]|uniref:myelin-associated glycoprotein-like n=1 Tax=Pempheris klunzingeri TaxID=3127111 RepID=UPI0039809D44